MADMVEAVKTAAMQAVDAAKLTGVYYGTVVSASPLKIDVEQKMILASEQLILTRNVTDHVVEMTVDHETEDAEAHKHEYKGRKKFTVHNGLSGGEKVLLLRVQGGQKFVVWDRTS